MGVKELDEEWPIGMDVEGTAEDVSVDWVGEAVRADSGTAGRAKSDVADSDDLLGVGVDDEGADWSAVTVDELSARNNTDGVGTSLASLVILMASSDLGILVGRGL